MDVLRSLWWRWSNVLVFVKLRQSPDAMPLPGQIVTGRLRGMPP